MFHTTREGQTMPIAAMDDEHLINTINFFAKAGISATENITQEIKQSRRSKALYGDRQLNDNQYKEIITRTVLKLGPYVIEATIRGLDIRETLIKLMGRNAKDDEAPNTITSSEELLLTYKIGNKTLQELFDDPEDDDPGMFDDDIF